MSTDGRPHRIDRSVDGRPQSLGERQGMRRPEVVPFAPNFRARFIATPHSEVAMLESPRIVKRDARPTAVIPLEIPREEMGEAFGAGVQELMEVLSEQDVEPAGPVFAHHLRMRPDTFHFELGVAVAEPVEPQGRVEPGTAPAATLARTVYHGAYEGLPDAWGEFDSWIESRGYDAGGDVWEAYVEGPHSSADPSTWRTELSRPVRVGGGS